MSADLEAEAKKVADEVAGKCRAHGLNFFPGGHEAEQNGLFLSRVSWPILLAFAERVRTAEAKRWADPEELAVWKSRAEQAEEESRIRTWELAALTHYERAEAAEAEVERLRGAIHSALGNGSDEEAWPPGVPAHEAIASLVGSLKAENEQQRKDLKQLNSRVLSLEKLNFAPSEVLEKS